jgi:hypothetical protein
MVSGKVKQSSLSLIGATYLMSVFPPRYVPGSVDCGPLFKCKDEVTSLCGDVCDCMEGGC